ncbi:phosphate transport system substrate-binding protein [Bacillus sp. OV322]|uniref:PstS family phosphate ABC transporter substrate-binding protein n=1 Tax=Bacillus sp. OV322 TaxID=1882764 RepID=UPI0008E9D3D5|nr:substrate-binding domain-containing protein [Bacillus sp. OV322]SFC00195.1 phosphate transport system substrate-binding protein [Bacillus sp. OV322]
MKDSIKFFVIYLGFVPFFVSLAALVILMTGIIQNEAVVILGTLIAGGAAAGILTGKEKQMHPGFKRRYLPCIVSILFTAACWSLCIFISGGFYGHRVWDIYGFIQLPFILVNFIAAFIGDGPLFLYGPLSYELAFTAGFFFSERRRKDASPAELKKILPWSAAITLIFAAGSAVLWHRSLNVLPSYGMEYGNGYSSTDLTPYEVTNGSNILPKLEGESLYNIKDKKDMPVLDGAEAAFPVYSAFAQAAYRNIGSIDQEREIVSFNNTIYAFERLVDGEADIYFGAEPSIDQIKLAKKKHKEIVMTPIGKEAFVFFVNKENPVKGLTSAEIKDIYTGNITNWKSLGGKDKKILAFQRPGNSGSQTILEKLVGKEHLKEPLKEEVPEGMGGIIEQVADYRDYDNSIGFSFRYFASKMNSSKNIKFLSINGVDPNTANISNETYPFTANLYAITLRDNPNPEIHPFLKWMKGKQGQELVEKVGYVKAQ